MCTTLYMVPVLLKMCVRCA
uniref:Uncharacterized protein n=1 Tax=Rhizophora mucronata TaxID=61149 RepID=A0A2P2JBK4_RHIMU